MLNSLADWLTTVRLSLHVVAATVWVGGQITMVGLLPDLRRLGGDAAVRIAGAFAKVAWPAFLVLILTGIWNVAAEHVSHSTTSWKVILGVKIGVVALSGLAAWFHGRAASKGAIAWWGSISGTAAIGALVLGVLLAG